MIETPSVRIEEVAFALGDGRRTLFDLACEAVEKIADKRVGAVVAATFSNPERFPSLAVRIASRLRLPASTPAFDLQMACSAYPYALYVAGALSRDLNAKVLLVDGDAQTRLVDKSDHATGGIFSDAVTASVVSSSAEEGEKSFFDFYSREDESLTCSEAGPIAMDGMKVFSFVATEVQSFIRSFKTSLPEGDFSFVPHQANPYMVRQLAKSLQLDDALLTLNDDIKNPGSCSIPLTLALSRPKPRALLAGFGAGFSASLAFVNVASVDPHFETGQ